MENTVLSPILPETITAENRPIPSWLKRNCVLFAATTGNMLTDRRSHTSTFFNNGKVLVAGGFDGTVAISLVELYDPVAQTFNTTTGNMQTARAHHSATLLSNGKVLLDGGCSGTTCGTAVLTLAELYNPITNTFTTTTGGLTASRDNHTATLLGNGWEN